MRWTYTPQDGLENPSSSLGANQRGSSLIVVLFILLIVTILGVTAMRQGLTSLNISTNAQVRLILFQSSDTVLNKFTQTNLSTVDSLTGVIGAALANPTPLQEYVFCYRPTSAQPFAQAWNANVIQGSSTSDAAAQISGANGFCNLAADFGSSRTGVVTQVAVSIPTTAIAGGLCPTCATDGTDVAGDSGIPKNVSTYQRFRVTSTAILPAFSTASTTAVQTNCLGSGSTPGRISDNSDPSLKNTETLTDCLARYGVPANTQVEDFNLTSFLSQTTAPTP